MAKVRKYRSVEACLWSAFAHAYDFESEQRYYHIWAIREGLRRLQHFAYQPWQEVKARKKHECARGCKIKAGHIYFKFGEGATWGSGLKVCAGCVAMILYFQQAYNAPPVAFTHWDWELQEPVWKDENGR